MSEREYRSSILASFTMAAQEAGLQMVPRDEGALWLEGAHEELSRMVKAWPWDPAPMTREAVAERVGVLLDRAEDERLRAMDRESLIEQIMYAEDAKAN